MKEEELLEMNRKLEKMIDRTTEIFEELIDTQGSSLALHYKSDPQYLCLLRQKDGNGKCNGVIWKKYRPGRGGRMWLSGWSVEKTPVANLIKKMNGDDTLKFRETHDLAKVTHKTRKELISKKKKLQGLLVAVRDFEERHMKKLEEAYGNVFIDA